MLPKPIPRVKAPRRLKRSAPPRRTSSPRQRSARRSAVEAKDTRWRRGVMARAGNVCERCGVLGSFPFFPLDAHHIQGKKAHPELRWSQSNGIALCRLCHDWAHAYRRHFMAWLATERAA